MTLPLDTAPGPSPDAEAIRNAGISQELLTNARLELDAGDLLQASDKAWGAAAFAIKAVAEKRRWFNDADWKLGNAVQIIASEQADNQIVACYLAARDAHYNYYHHEYNALAVRRTIDLAAQLVELLNPLLSPNYTPPSYISAEVETEKRRLEQPTSQRDYDRLANGRPPIEQRPPLAHPPSPDTPPENGAAPQ